jgi:PAS domain S-box-containing protein|tara:strand:+ start:230 stop:1852 length:1623 start_codon:yes stop_codon:yes gene_type:complete
MLGGSEVLTVERKTAPKIAGNTNPLAAKRRSIHEMDLARVFEYSRDIIFLCDGDRVVFLNSAGRRLLLGSENQAIAGRSFCDFLAPDYAPAISGPEMFDGLVSADGPIPLKLRSAVGDDISADVSFFEAGDFGPGMTVISAHDITKRVRLTEDIQHSETRYRKLIDNSQNMSCICDGGDIIFINRAGIALLGGTDAGQFIGRSLFDFIQAEYREIMRDSLADILAGVELLLVKLVGLDGSIQDVRMNLTPLNDDGSSRFMVEVCNVTQQNRAVAKLHKTNLALKRRAKELLKAKERAELADRVKTHFLANMSHELRTPLNAVVGFSDLMRSEAFGALGSDQYKDYARLIHQSGTHLLKIINDILELSSIETGEQSVIESEVNLDNAIETCMKLIENRAGKKDIELVQERARVQTVVMADDIKIRQVLMNLLSNAVKFTEAGGTVTVGCALDDSDQAVLSVEDTGIGIEADNISRILSPFNQVEDDSLTRSHEGAGLGLSIAKSFANLHGGSLEIESQLGKGTRVSVILPAMRTVAATLEK